ncbi:MAG: glycogen synthase [bacterium]|nr:glycogen synthase [bacterium]
MKKVLLAASECTPYAKVGGLGDVIGALASSMKENGIQADIVLPYYEPLSKYDFEKVLVLGGETFEIPFLGKSETCSLYKLNIPNTNNVLYGVGNDKYLSNGGIYLSDDAFSKGDDEPKRFLLFCKAVYYLMESGVFQYEVLHCHDWHTSLLTHLVRRGGLKCRTILSLHNLANVGAVESSELNLEIDGTSKSHFMIEVGLDNADAIVPVSRVYCEELLSGLYTEGLDLAIQRNKEKFVGIINGIDTKYFDPQSDTFLRVNYGLENWDEGKSDAKKYLFAKFKWDESITDKICLVGMVGRIAQQKNIELMCDVIGKLKDENIRFVILGVGDKLLESKLRELSLQYPEKIVFVNRFDESLARYIYAGSDVVAVPSLFEPCGLTQMIAMRYGALPVVRKVGGLAETVDNQEDGFVFNNSDSVELCDLLKKVENMWRRERSEWNRRVRNSLNKDFTWTKSALEYIKIYRSF